MNYLNRLAILLFLLISIPAFSQQQHHDSLLLDAAINDDIEKVKQFIDLGADIETQYPKDDIFNGGYRPLHLALASLEDYKTAIYLIESGADVNAEIMNSSCRGCRPIHIICHKGALLSKNETFKVIRLLIEKGIDINSKTVLGESALHYACMNEDGVDIAKYLIENGANVNAKTVLDATPLHFACEIGAGRQIISLLIEKGAEINSKAFMGRTALHIAASVNNLIAAELLCEAGADINIKNDEGLTAIELSKNTSSDEVYEYLKNRK